MSDLGDRDDEPGVSDDTSESQPEPSGAGGPPTVDLPGAAARPAPVDLDAIERDLDAVDQALDRLADGTYGTDEVTGEPIPDDVLETDPTARRA